MTERADLEYDSLDEAALQRFAEQLAPRLRRGDFIGLYGDLGAGKTAFARHLIRALTGQADEEVPSPTFTLVQPYDTPRFSVYHFDFYRLSGAVDADELGLDEARETGVVIAEWPERLEDEAPADRLEIRLEDCGKTEYRDVTITGLKGWASRLRRLQKITEFIDNAGWRDAKPVYVNGDASTRSYMRLIRDGLSVLLMDSPRMPDGPPIRDGKPYSQIAHLAEDVRPFVAVAHALRQAGLCAPEILAQDLDAGLLLIEDFGDLTLTKLAAQGADLMPCYRLAADALLKLRGSPPAEVIRTGTVEHRLPHYDKDALAIETELLTDWLLPALTGGQPEQAVHETFSTLWSVQFAWLHDQSSGWVLRDFHSPNLLWRPDRSGLDRLGIIDFQDAMRGHSAYDLVSLLQDARLDLPDHLEAELLDHYCNGAAKQPDFNRADFLRAYRLLGAQRATKILGIFARLSRRDGKHGYLQHLPRMLKYLRANLQDPHLAKLKSWYEREMPDDMSPLMNSYMRRG